MARTKFTLNHSNVGKILKSDGVRRDLTKRAERVLAEAESTAPVESGAYRDGLEIVQETTDRAVVRVAGTVAYTLRVEAETGNLSRALDAAGGD